MSKTAVYALGTIFACLLIVVMVTDCNWTGEAPVGIARGSDGSMWFTDSTSGRIVRIARSGKLPAFAIPTSMSMPTEITADVAGNLWLIETPVSQSAAHSGRVSPQGGITESPMPSSSSKPVALAADPHGNIWFA